jgi:NAD(P)-dependent dehydrogenase (short-subunit alcohol dehydrogenase family)
MPGRLEAKVVLVTGGSTGIGRAVAARSLAEGAAVVIAGRRRDVGERTAAELRAAVDTSGTGGGDVRFVAADVTSEEQVSALVDTTVRTFGRLDAAFNNAGIQAPPADTADARSEDFDRVNAINLRGVWACMKYELRQMREQGSGAIVNCSSIGACVQTRSDRADEECCARVCLQGYSH